MTTPPLCVHYRMEPASVIRSLSGKTYALNLARKITLWRRLKLTDRRPAPEMPQPTP